MFQMRFYHSHRLLLMAPTIPRKALSEALPKVIAPIMVTFLPRLSGLEPCALSPLKALA